MAPEYYNSGGDVIRTGFGYVPADALADTFEDLEVRRESALARGHVATARWLGLQHLSLSFAVTEAAKWKRASGGLPSLRLSAT